MMAKMGDLEIHFKMGIDVIEGMEAIADEYERLAAEYRKAATQLRKTPAFRDKPEDKPTKEPT